MSNLAAKLNLTNLQLTAVVGFIIILISIPLAFSLLKTSQIWKSRATSQPPPQNPSQQMTLTPGQGAIKPSPKEVPAESPLSELNKLLTSLTPTPTSIPVAGFGPTLTFQVNLEGRSEGKQSGKVFLGLISGVKTPKPTYLLTFTIDLPASGQITGLSLAGLTNGSTYTAYLKGPSQIDQAVTFVMTPIETRLNNGNPILLLSGDLNEDNIVNSADYTIAKSLYGKKIDSTGWNERADFNGDGIINNLDLGYIIKNFGKTGASGAWYSPIPPAATASATPRAGGPQDSVSNRSGYWLWVP